MTYKLRILAHRLLFHMLLSVVLTSLSCGCFKAAFAAPTQEEQQRIEQEQERLLRRDEERRKELERQRKLREMTPPEPEEEKSSPKTGDTKRCVSVREIQLIGFRTISPEPYRKIVSAFTEKCLNTKQMQDVLTALNDAFRDAGYVTTRAYLAPQDMVDGVLTITIIEGKVEDLRLNKNRQGDRYQLYFAFPTSEGKTLNLRDVEQGLDQMNRLASNNAKMEIKPGKEPGQSVVDVSNEVGDRFRIELGRDNSGTSSTGILQNVASFSADNVLSIEDGWSFNYSSNARNYGRDRRSESLSGTFSLPFGYSTFTYSGSYYSYFSLAKGDVQDFQTSGISTSHKIEISQIFHRDQISKTRTDISLTSKRSRNYIEDTLLDTSSRRLSVLKLALAHSTRIFDGVLSLDIAHEHGLRILGAKRDNSDQPNGDPKAQFRKWTFDATFYRPINLGEQAIQWNSTTHWQYAPDTLFGSERVGIGGQYSVRGFRDDTFSGDRGGYWRNELAWRLPTSDLGHLNRVIGRVSTYAAYDWGWIKKDRAEGREHGAASSWTMGLRNSAENASFDLSYSRALTAPQFLSVENHEIDFRAIVRF